VAQYANALFDGRYLYLVPKTSYSGPAPAVRVEPARFTDSTAWELFDATSVPMPAAPGFESATFDGRYVYMWGTSYMGSGAVVVRYDTQRQFDDSTAWGSVDFRANSSDAAPTDPYQFMGSTFDGRYIYAIVGDAAGDAIAIWRYDSTSPFVAASFERAAIPDVLTDPKLPPKISLYGATFDGRYAYFAAARNGAYTQDMAMVRFDAKSPPALPRGARSTFF
jgi:hypothetical protein